MEEIPTYREMAPGEEQEACDLVARVFKDFVGIVYSNEGVHEFLQYAQPELLSQRLQTNHFALVAEIHGQIGGVIEVRNHDHISLFFVEGEWQRRGIGKQLWRHALERCLANRAGLKKITVLSAPEAVGAYCTLGFETEGPEQTVKGIRFVPMVFNVKKQSRE